MSHAASPTQSADSSPFLIDLTLIAPAHNEEANIAALVAQAESGLNKTGLSYEFIIVDDGSTDGTRLQALRLMEGDAPIDHTHGAAGKVTARPPKPWLRCIAMTDTPRGKGNGQSAAFHAGIRAARGRLIATIDADLQNDPHDLPAMIKLMTEQNADMVQGDRSHARKDNLIRRASSRVGRFFRAMILRDVVRDTGCSLRVMKREGALRLPLEFKGMHRFIPVTFAMMGYKVVQMPVTHRPRIAGTSKYGMGILQRALPGLVDCFAVRWMSKRRRPVKGVEVGGSR